MTRYRVFEPAGEAGRSEAARFVADTFSVVALVLPALWLLRHRLILAAIAVVAVDILVAVALGGEGAGRFSAGVLSLLLGLAVALEGASLRARRLAARGFVETAVVTAGSLREAELLYFGDGPVPDAPMPDPLPPAAPREAARLSLLSLRRPAGRTLFDLPEPR